VDVDIISLISHALWHIKDYRRSPIYARINFPATRD